MSINTPEAATTLAKLRKLHSDYVGYSVAIKQTQLAMRDTERYIIAYLIDNHMTHCFTVKWSALNRELRNE